MGCVTDAAGAQPIERGEHRLPPGEERDTPLALRQVAPAAGPVKPVPVVLAHGATFGSIMFDIPVAGYSLQDYLARRGWCTFAFDVRGYGCSVPAPVLDEKPHENEPYAGLVDAVDDLTTAVRFALRETGGKAAHVIGFSWGTVTACVLAARSADLVDHLVLYAPLFAEVNDCWISRLTDREDRRRLSATTGAYRWITYADVRSRWDGDIPEGASTNDYREDRVLDAIFSTLVAADPGAEDRSEPAFRVPTGALVDLLEVFSGRSLYDPSAITVPTLIVRGRDDTTATESDSLKLFSMLGAPRKRYVTICPGSHFLCAERNARELFGEIELFLNQ